MDPAPCPCGLPETYAACCGRFHGGGAAALAAPTAELLMRSRYSAFAVGDTAYLLRTWHPGTRPARLRLDPGQEWTGLEILGRTGGGLLTNEGTVEFRAHYRHRGRDGFQQENSRFRREDGRWVYLDADG
jgi:SEC-C motif-containing protein